MVEQIYNILKSQPFRIPAAIWTCEQRKQKQVFTQQAV